MSTIGLAEFRNVVALKLRDTALPMAEFDAGWFATVVGQLMKDFAEARIVVCNQPAKVLDHAIMLVDLAARQHGRSFRVWDAAHLVIATAWAEDLGQQVEFWTCDDDFQEFIALYPYFAKLIRLRDVNP